MNWIIRPITEDKMVGFDEFNQLLMCKQEGTSLYYTPIADVRDEICIICIHRWEATSESIGDQYFHDGKKRWMHKSCFKRYLALKEFEFWHHALCETRFRCGSLSEIENEYKGAWNLPWYEAYLIERRCTLKLGTRKRVYHMEIVPRGEDRIDIVLASQLFRNEDVTKEINRDRIFVHAWSEDKVLEYLRYFSRILGLFDECIHEARKADQGN